MNKKHFYLYGIIANEPGSFAADYGIVSAKMVADFVAASADAEELVVHINSNGGDVDEGFAIHDILATSGKKITTIIEGMCASIATVPALAGSTREMTENSTFFIHNAWGGAMGDAEELQRYADACQAATDKIIDFYVKKTGADRQAIADMMDADTSMTADQAKTLGFITEVKIAMAAKKALTLTKVNSKNPNNNSFDMKAEIKNFLAEIKKGLGIKNDATAVVAKVEVETDKGKLYCESPKMEGVLSVDDVVTIDGAPAPEGDYTTNDGTVYAVDAAGKITAVTVKEEDNKDSEEVAALKAELAEAKKSLETLKAEKEANEAEVEKELKAIKAQITSGYVPPKGKQTFNKGAQNDAGSENPAEDLKARKEEYKTKKPGQNTRIAD